MIEKLRFDKSRISLQDAAIVLATSQEPWAEYLWCSLLDWFDHPWARRSCDLVVAVMFDDHWSFHHDWEKDPFYLTAYHKIMIRPSSDVPPGWISLKENFNEPLDNSNLGP